MKPGDPITSSIVCIERMQEIVLQNFNSISAATGRIPPSSVQALHSTNSSPIPAHEQTNIYGGVLPALNDGSSGFMNLWQPELFNSHLSADFGNMSWVYDVAASDPSSIFPTTILSQQQGGL